MTAQKEKSITVEKEENPTLAVTPQSLEFGNNVTQLKFSITNSGGGSVTYNITDNKNWLTVSPASGETATETDEITVTVDRSSLTPGDYSGKVTVSSDAENIDVNVTMNVSDQFGTLTGTVYQINTNVAVSGVLVEAGGKSATSAGDGAYRIENISAGEVTVRATKTDYEIYEQTVTITANQTKQHNIYMTGSILSTNISGVVKDNITGELLSNVKVSIAGKEDYTDQNRYKKCDYEVQDKSNTKTFEVDTCPPIIKAGNLEGLVKYITRDEK